MKVSFLNIYCRVILGLCATMMGCSKEPSPYPPTVPVIGTVLFKGEPLEGAHVMFQRTDGTRGAVGKTDCNGVFRLTTYTVEDGAREGEYQVLVTKYDELPLNAPDGITLPLNNQIPDKYSSAKLSDLTAVVQGERAEFKFELN